MLVRTEGIVLRSMPYRETSKLVTLYTRELGKITIIARGGQSLKNRFGSTLQLLSHVQAVIFSRPTRSIQVLSECSHITVYSDIREDLEKLTIGQRICEIVLKITEEGQRSFELFQLLINVLTALNDPKSNGLVLNLYFQIQFTQQLGFAPAFSKESVEEIDTSGGYLILNDGTISNEVKDEPSAVYASRGVLRAFSILCRADFDVILKLKLTKKQYPELQNLINQFMSYHMPETFPVRGQKITDQILQSSQK
ncbi:MAG: DNA repair protein RecO [Bacteroidetes bacterium]|nr:DNA repair protein RecO [Bacteroidota bacterium]